MDTPPKHITTSIPRRQSKHWADFEHHRLRGPRPFFFEHHRLRGPRPFFSEDRWAKEEFAARAEDRFFEWLLGDQHA